MNTFFGRLKRAFIGTWAGNAGDARPYRAPNAGDAPQSTSVTPSADICPLYPVVLPFDFLDLEWPGPIEQIGTIPFALGWAIIPEPNRFFYVTFEQAAVWEAAGQNWKRAAFRNLAALTSEGRFGFKADDDGQIFIRVMLHDDAMGPSRLLIPNLFDSELGRDYMVAVPERTCALAFKADLDEGPSSDVAGMIDGCYQNGTEPVSPLRFRAQEFWQPAAEYLSG